MVKVSLLFLLFNVHISNAQSVTSEYDKIVVKYLYDSFLKHSNFYLVDSSYQLENLICDSINKHKLQKFLLKNKIDTSNFINKFNKTSFSSIPLFKKHKYNINIVNAKLITEISQKYENDDDFWLELDKSYGLDGYAIFSNLLRIQKGNSYLYFFYFSFQRGSYCCSNGWYIIKLCNKKVLDIKEL
jgi:hypothetical protein